ncbi:hypothetical protein BpHYR1_021993 [Brachionus plicatilis]|uniref:Uncharacterized protein n=1 Tax=Brachionus plicatilis TaxID=10195 RepID=A0A3M7RFS7_BRAPC|nr:hypothetical protein BpHYR1_021993 [Brachionus plicatilis]
MKKYSTNYIRQKKCSIYFFVFFDRAGLPLCLYRGYIGFYKCKVIKFHFNQLQIKKQEECQWRFLKLYIIEFTYNRITYNRISTVLINSNFLIHSMTPFMMCKIEI